MGLGIILLKVLAILVLCAAVIAAVVMFLKRKSDNERYEEIPVTAETEFPSAVNAGLKTDEYIRDLQRTAESIIQRIDARSENAEALVHDMDERISTMIEILARYDNLMENAGSQIEKKKVIDHRKKSEGKQADTNDGNANHTNVINIRGHKHDTAQSQHKNIGIEDNGSKKKAHARSESNGTSKNKSDQRAVHEDPPNQTNVKGLSDLSAGSSYKDDLKSGKISIHDRVRHLADEGKRDEDIARELDMGIGEVQLIIGLNKRSGLV